MERLKERVAHIGQYAVTLLKWMVLGGVIGLVGGIIGSLFHIGVDTATQVRLAHSWVLYLMPVGGLAIVGLYRLTKTEGKGTNDIIASVHFGEQVPGLLVPVIFVSTVITHLCGGSAGRLKIWRSKPALWWSGSSRTGTSSRAIRRGGCCVWGRRICRWLPCAA